MPTRTHNQNDLLFGSQNGLCDECGFKFKQVDLRKKWDGLVVCRDCWESQHSSDLYNYLSRDNGGGAGASTRPADDMNQTGTDIEGNAVPPVIDIQPTTLALSYNGVYVENDLYITGSTQDDLTWTLASGSLPDGISLNSVTGMLSGTPTSTATFVFSITATKVDGRTDTQAYSWEIAAGAPVSFGVSTIPIGGSGGQPGAGHSGRSYFADGTVVKIGGAVGTTDNVKMAFLDTDTYTWSYSTSKIPFRTYGTRFVITEYNDTLLIYSAGGAIRRYDRDLETWTTIATKLYVVGIAMCEENGKVYAFGGNYYNDNVNRYECYIIDLDTWAVTTAATPVPDNLAGHFAIGLGDGRILIGGGSSPNRGDITPEPLVWFYDTVTDTYTPTTNIPTEMSKPWTTPGHLLSDGRAIFFGGTQDGTGTPIRHQFIFDPDTETWEVTENIMIYGATVASSIGGYHMWQLPDGRFLQQLTLNGGSSWVSSDI